MVAGLILAFLSGALFGILVMALCQAAKEFEYEEEEETHGNDD